ncbi:Anaerobic nitric oxide reductase transcription regulator NorR [Pararobbsia alpina]|uniref:Anaerobic nitric oxide reductase transcription regulator NorR n=2 Tax=Pararobbsia alpina TaxID=621374 RepID=A0A6S7BIU4_9BURK|nr:sigma-54-dependent Fis family transcriptional regulator [Pararobbsia alpina]CAB3790020.1 Anaerobic nitric oxide reductase transcription regulator NorR [Pararobbsia alpina]
MSPADTDRPLILVVEDVPANLSILLDLLSGDRFAVSVAEDGESALEQVNYVRPDIILLDVMMPRLDGFATCRQLKANPATRDIPIIFMTGLTDTVDKVRGLELGAVDYITKPFQHEEVLARVSIHLELKQLRQRLQESEERLSRIIESAMDAIVALDHEGRVTLFNRAAERVFRCPASAAVGRFCKQFLAARLCRVLGDYMRCDGRPAPIWVPEGHSAVRADGEAFRIEASLSCAEAGGQTIYILILRDIEERRQAEAEVGQLRGLNRYLQEELLEAQAGEELVGAAGLHHVLEQVRQVAGTDASVLVSGETGTGKELIAQAIHRKSARGNKPLVKLNCAALPANLIESELFGHEKGAFTGAVARKAGRFELADGGTLFLDEIGELALDLQAKLLRVLQDGEFERLGGTRTQKVDVRIIAATNRSLAEEAAAGRFRADLYYRLNVFPIALPPLRERTGDIAPLVAYFVRRYAAKYGKHIDAVPEARLGVLQGYRWPGNVRELQHVIERAVILTQGSQLALGDWFRDVTPTARDALTLEDAERAHILKALEQTGWRVSGKAGAAERLGLRPTTLESRMKRLAITRKA